VSEERIFGTDGVRGRAGEGWLAVASVARLGRAIGDVLGRDARVRRRALLGHDGRRSGPELLAALARGLASSGFDSASVDLIPTPGLAWLTRDADFGLGLMVSASHNPARDNGIKVFSSTGEKLSDETEIEIEDRVRAEVAAPPAAGEPRIDAGLEERYVEHLIGQGSGAPDLAGMELVVDCANGATSRVAPRVLERLSARVTSIASSPDGDNINLACGSTHPEALQAEVRRTGAELGIALDGDGDRCILVDHAGEIVHGDAILTILARDAQQRGQLPGSRIVATVMSNRGLQRALREVGVSVLEVGVGDRQVVEAMRRNYLELGGEQSGHIVLGPRNAFIGDGLLTALQVLRVVRESGRPLAELARPYEPLPQVLLNVPVLRKPLLEELPELVAAVRRIETELGEDGRVLLRYSGTEPLARVMVEGPDSTEIRARAEELAALISDAIGGSR